jgi:LPXTG-motif cell wall-anchored protein
MKKNNFTKKIILFMLLVLCIAQLSFADVKTTASLKATLLSQNPDPVKPGAFTDVKFKIENIGNTNMQEAIFELVSDYPISIDSEINQRKVVGTIYGNQIDENAYVLNYKFKISSSAVKGQYDIYLRYSDNNGETWKTFQPFKINVDSQSPLLSISEVTATPQKVGPGEEMDLKITLENNENFPIQNIQVNLLLYNIQGTTPETINIPFSPIDSSTEKIIKRLDKKSAKTVNYKLISDVDASSKTYKIPIEIIYEDEDGQSYTKNTLISAQIGKEPSLLVIKDSREKIIQDKESAMDIKFTNNGLVNIKLITLEVIDSEDFNLITPKIEYVGNIDSDDYQSIEIILKSKSDSNEYINIPLKVTYLDENNREYTEEIKIHAEHLSYTKALETGIIQEKSMTGILVFIGIIIIGIGIYIYFKKRKHKED